MKIGIITITDYTNLGNRLQNYALTQALQNLGHSVVTLKTRNPGDPGLKESQSGMAWATRKGNSLRRRIKRYLRSTRLGALAKAKKKALFDFSLRYLNESQAYLEGSELNDIHQQFDAIVLGSDQIWNPNFRFGSPIDFGRFAPIEKRIAYAASFGVDSIPEAYQTLYQTYMNEIPRISVRENAGAEIVQSIIGRKVPVVLDPTMLIEASQWKALANTSSLVVPSRSFVTYFLGQPGPQVSRAAQIISQKTGLSEFEIADPKVKGTFAIDPADFLKAILSSSYVLTDSFHGVVFAILFHKPFTLLKREGTKQSMDSRIDTLMSRFKLQDRLWENMDTESVLSEIDYTLVDKILCQAKTESLGFLMSALATINTTRSQPKVVVEELLAVCREDLFIYPTVSSQTLETRARSVIKTIFNPSAPIDRFDWPNGLLAQALSVAIETTPNNDDLKALERYAMNWIHSPQPFRHLDNAVNGTALISLVEKAGNPQVKAHLDALAHYLLNHPKDLAGSLVYRSKRIDPRRDQDVYVDSIGMICPFLIRYGLLINDPKLIELGIIQLRNFLKHGFDPQSGLPYHAYSLSQKRKLGIIGWGRGVGWLLMGYAESLVAMDPAHPEFNSLRENFIELVTVVLKYQRADGSFAWQLQATEGNADSSASAMIAYAIALGVRHGFLSQDLNNVVNQAKIALASAIRNGKVYGATAECPGLGQYPMKTGWKPWSQGPATMLFCLTDPDSKIEHD